jgi:hypothetical protein
MMMTEVDSGAICAVVEAKMRYATDAVESALYSRSGIVADFEKLTKVPEQIPRFLLVWAPYFSVVCRRLRWMAGHQRVDDGGWRPRIGLDECRQATKAILDALPAQPTLAPVREADGEDGQLALDAWLARAGRSMKAGIGT